MLLCTRLKGMRLSKNYTSISLLSVCESWVYKIIIIDKMSLFKDKLVDGDKGKVMLQCSK